MSTQITIARVYENLGESDDYRILIDRLWPRGISKEKAALNQWAKEIAPSNELRKWFHNNLSQWDKFKELYEQELNENRCLIDSLFQEIHSKKILLLYSTKNVKNNHAQILKDFLEQKIFF